MIQVQSEEVTVDTIERRVIETTDRAKPMHFVLLWIVISHFSCYFLSYKG